MTKKSILYIITKSVWGGAQKYTHDLAVALPKEYKVAIAGGGRGPMAEKIISAGIPYFEIKAFQRDVNVFKDVWAFFEILSILFKTKPDIAHVSSAKAGGVAGLAIKIYSLLVTRYSLLAVFTAHGWTFNETRPKWQIFLIKIFSKITCLFYDKIICVSEYDRQVALKNKIAPEKKLITIHNGIKPEDYIFFERTEKRFTVGTIGEAIKNKGHEYLREAAKNFPDINLNIISGLPDAAKYLKNFDIFILPSLKEGLPYVILEAGLAELPVIATNVGGIPEIIGSTSSPQEQAGILIPPANSKKIADAIEKLMGDEKLRKTMAQNLHQKVLKDFSFEKMLQQTLTAYED
ncbi:MAG: glycosyltransferase [Candidatus Paceibacterota bacterium]